jgi:hypothetical protein
VLEPVLPLDDESSSSVVVEEGILSFQGQLDPSLNEPLRDIRGAWINAPKDIPELLTIPSL